MFNRWPSDDQLERYHIVPHERLEAEAARHRELTAVHGVEVPTLMGKFGVGASALGVTLVFFPGFDDDAISARMSRYPIGQAAWGEQRAIEAGLELIGYALGEVRHLESPVDLAFVTPFQREVYHALRSIPFGETITYGELAALAGHPGKARAVGGALGANPAPIFIPCHRVLPAGGGLGGWSGPAGWKKVLLEHEGISVG